MPASADELLGQLLDRSHMMNPARINIEAADLVSMIGGRDLAIYVVDYAQRKLVPLADSGRGEILDIEGTMAGRAFITGELVEVEVDDGRRLWAPLLDGADRIGVVEVTLGDVDDRLRDTTMRYAGLITQLIVTEGEYTDAIEKAARQQPMTIAAEMLWRQLPPLTFTTQRVAVAAILEPAYEIGGDAFDYAHNDDVTDLAIIDSMGHGLTAAWPASVALAGLRHSRSAGLDLPATYEAVSALVAAEFDGEHFITAQFGHLDCLTGDFSWLNAGHPAPLLVRRGRVVGHLVCAPSLPLGLGGGVEEVASTRLQPWDRVLFFTDGVVEGHRRGNEPFGTDRLAGLLSSATLAGKGPAETMRRLAHSILDHHDHHLSDDFTMVVVEYRPGTDDVDADEHAFHPHAQASA